jgi:hypothetical protein
MKLLVIAALSALPFMYLTAAAQDMQEHGMKDMFVHPFLAHMALPDMPGEVSLRVTPFQERSGADTRSDYAIHIEAGLFRDVGLHARTDALKAAPWSEVMIMYSPLHDDALSRGLSVFGQISIPTGPIASNTYKGLFGIAARGTVPGIVVADANIHVDLKDEMAEYEGAFVFKASEMFYPIVELRGEIMENATTLYSLLGLKFRVADDIAWGFGVQLPITTEREYDTQLLGTFGIAF